MPFIDTSQLAIKEPLPGWKGRFFSSESMLFGYYTVEAGASIHEHSHPNEEVWNVIDGELEVTIAGVTQVARAGCVAVKLSILCILMFATCATAQTTTPPQVDIIPDVVYGHKDGLALTFDVLKPKAKANGAAVIFMVSAGWVSSYSPPQQTAVRFKDLLEKGFTLIPVRHGSSPRYVIPDIVSDVRRAVRFIRYNAKQWGIDPSRLGVFGGSAGGHLSLVLGTASDTGDPAAKEDFMKESDRVAAIVAYFPPVDLRLIARGVNPAPTGGTGDRFPALNFDKAKAPDYSPILFVSPDDPPTLLIHGDKDDLVPISNSQRIYDAFQQNKVKTQFITIEGAGHGFRGDDAKRATAAMVAWFEQTLLKSPVKPNP